MWRVKLLPHRNLFMSIGHCCCCCFFPLNSHLKCGFWIINDVQKAEFSNVMSIQLRVSIHPWVWAIAWLYTATERKWMGASERLCVCATVFVRPFLSVKGNMVKCYMLIGRWLRWLSPFRTTKCLLQPSGWIKLLFIKIPPEPTKKSKSR